MNLRRILENEELREQVLSQLGSDAMAERLRPRNLDPAKVRTAAENVSRGLESAPAPEYEAIIRRVGRPVLYIQDDQIEEPELDYWKTWIEKARQTLAKVIPAVGRIELLNDPDYDWVGTGWVVAPEVIVTNRHVAHVFARREQGELAFRHDPDGRRIRAEIDFKREHERPTTSEFRIRRILYVEEDARGSADIAFLQVDREGHDDQPLADPVPLAESDAVGEQVIACIGYAGWDGKRNDPEWMREIFEDVYDVKRLHPGEVMDSTGTHLTHDCSTLGGNSGSTVLDLATGTAVGLHFSGRFSKQNYAVKASTVRDRLGRLEVL